ncbi:DUF3824 domain-containing protein [Streptomyces silvisoli]|uniref:DUF3824 domain-containing protein n=1 Tax=Streptomyces silvisoli TaxID=3034235 RepID=A0ABT5ZN30_9ACTN|nr:DUF3824 domain-containing protein [Streptomyces silvisoli]MDF3291217.1 DUF3824 domain-containing protein [Streptomyces silvisoli]
MSFNQPPPNPYGQQPGPQPGYGYPQQGGVPPQPNPYGQPGQPPTSPYGQPPANAPYGMPPQGQNPYVQQPGWGAQVPPPPPVKKSNAGKVIGILAAVVVVAGAGIAFAVVGSGGGLTGGGDYKLTTPDTVLDGKYSKDTAKSSQMTNQMDSSVNDSGISEGKTAAAVWTGGSDGVVLSGAYGNVSDPSGAVDKVISEGLKGATTTKQTPSGFDGTIMKCGQQNEGVASMPFCVWGDSSTVAIAMWMPNIDPSNPTASLPTAPSISDWAQTTAKLRSEVRVKK